MNRAGKASTGKAQNDVKFAGKVNSVIECQRAIRASNAGDWVTTDMQDVLGATTRTHFAAFFRAGLVQNYLEVTSVFFDLLVTVPLGIQVLNGTMLLGDYVAVSKILVNQEGSSPPKL